MVVASVHDEVFMQRVLVNYLVTEGKFIMYDSLVAIKQVKAAAMLDLILFLT